MGMKNTQMVVCPRYLEVVSSLRKSHRMLSKCIVVLLLSCLLFQGSVEMQTDALARQA